MLTSLGDGERAVITQVAGGQLLEARLQNMGLRPGKLVTKLATMPGGGPVTVECDGFRVALGRGIASRVQVKRIAETTRSDEL
ncbi:MAG: ferrous iron transport protein A [Coriobacteriia bacterium]|nr:ferrous iron transport protein A [Coriobacteriia bacterium]